MLGITNHVLGFTLFAYGRLCNIYRAFFVVCPYLCVL